MLKKVEILQVTRDAVSELMGDNYDSSTKDSIATLPLSDLIDFGVNTVGINTTIPNDMWMKVLCGKCAEFIVENRKLELDLPQIFKTSFEWGGFIEVVKFDLQGVYDSLIYSQAALTDPNSKFYGKTIAEIEHDIYKVNFDSKIYDEFKDFMIPYTKPNDALKTGLRSENDYLKFMGGMITAIENTLTQIINTYGHALISSAIAYTMTEDGYTQGITGANVDGSNNCIHLLTEYIAVTGDNTWTAKKMLNSDDALAWINMRIENVRGYMKDNTQAYNNHEKPMFSTNIHGVMLKEVKNAYVNICTRNSYNPVTLGDWHFVNCWQSVKDSNGKYFEYDTNSTIMITKDGNKGIYGISGGTITDFVGENVIAFLYDEKAIGMTVNDTKTTSNYTSVTDTVNVFTNKRLNYVVNTDFPMVSFVLD